MMKLNIIRQCLFSIFSLWAVSVSASLSAQATQATQAPQAPQAAQAAPTGVRPCCAFGYDLKAQLGGIAVPFFSVGNVLGVESLGHHRYNQGDQSLSASLLGMSDEQNGLLFTARAGFIDSAHVRDTADFTFYLFRQNLATLGQEAKISLPAELRVRQIHWRAKDTVLSEQERITRSAQAASLVAFQLAQWHEIAQWFGLTSVGGFHELASAFSPEDLYSNMLGAVLAQEVLLAHPTATKKQFEQEFDRHFRAKLTQLEVQSAAVTKQKIQQLEGIWWDSQRRLPDKWLLLKRDYRLGYQLQPNYPNTDMSLALSPTFDNGERIEDWVELQLLNADSTAATESAFAAFLAQMPLAEVWTPSQFHWFAAFAMQQDSQAHPQQMAVQVERDDGARSSEQSSATGMH